VREFFRSIFFTERLYALLISAAALYVLGFFFFLVYTIARIYSFFLILCFIIDVLLLFIPRQPIQGRRRSSDRLSNGDDNVIIVLIDNKYPFSLALTIIDEIPFQFQKRDFRMHIRIGRREKSRCLTYSVRLSAANIFSAH
jgi:uncharacterized protein (DUF58 family)